VIQLPAESLVQDCSTTNTKLLLAFQRPFHLSRFLIAYDYRVAVLPAATQIANQIAMTGVLRRQHNKRHHL